MAISNWVASFAVTAALATGQELAVERASVTPVNFGVSSSDDARPITAKQRVQWVVFSTFGPQAIIGEAALAGIGTWRDKPAEFGSHWDGFGQRAGTLASGAAVSQTLEAGLGAIWGEDPRYVRDVGVPFKNRLAHVFILTFLARNRDGGLMPAYARYIAIPSTGALASTWLPARERTADYVGASIALGVLGRLGTNAFTEFWPDVRRHVLPRNARRPGLVNHQTR